MQKKCSILLIGILCTCTTQGVVQKTLSADVRCEAFDSTAGTWYLGLEEGGGDSAISCVFRFNGVGKPPVAGIATDTSLSDETIEFLSLAKAWNKPTQHIAVVKQSHGNSFEQTEANLVTRNGRTVTTSTAPDGNTSLNDANESTTAGIVGLAASSSYVFAAVRPNSGDFGDTNSGIALMTIDTTSNALTIKDATARPDGNKAQQFDATGALKIGVSDVIFPGSENENVRLLWDDKLQRLYAGVHVQSDGSGARSVAVCYIDTSGTLQTNAIALEAAFADNNTDIIGTANSADDYEVRAHHIRIMHASTGPSYLIVNGNVDPTNTGINSIFALPLVNNLSSETEHGTLADKDSTLQGGKFTTAATAPGELATNSDAAAMVGTGPLPLQPTNLISHIVVVGDTVYASLKEEQDDDNDSGIFYSQALFDETGKIIRWTPWTKRAFPFTAFPDLDTAADQSKIGFFSVDALNGKLYAINYTNKDQLSCNSWNMGNNTATSLARTVNSHLTHGCFSVLDLDQSTPGLGVSSPARYALFGGLEKVLFARVSQSRSAATYNVHANGYPAIQNVTSDFSDTSNFLLTQLPLGAGTVVALEYSRRTNTFVTQNYFFAGTQNGLYIFADNAGAGFTIGNSVDDLDAAPFDGKWQKLDGVEGSVISIKSSGSGDAFGAVYVLTLQSTKKEASPLISRLYSVSTATNVANMTVNLLAQSETSVTNSDLSTAKVIMGMEIISTKDDGSDEQLIIATNRGLFRSKSIKTNGIIGANSQAAALWEPVSAGGTAPFYNIFGVDNATVKTTVWPIEIADEKGMTTFEHSKIRQLHGTANTNTFPFLPLVFNSPDIDPAFQVTNGAIYFWSDGARRFFIVRETNDPGEKNRLMTLPYNTAAWSITTPYVYLSEHVLSTIPSFYWIKQIGATGILMAGTRKGIVALQ